MTSDKFFNAPPYVEGRYIISAGGVSSDVAPICHPETWRQAFGSGAVDWSQGWRTLWRCASGSLATGTDYRPDCTGVEVELYFRDGTQSSVGFLVRCEIDEDEWENRAVSWLVKASGDENPIAGCVGLVVDEDDPLARPCVTLMVSGPGGGLEAAQMIRLALAERGVAAGIAIRTTRRGEVGVVKAPIVPELYLGMSRPSYQINWQLWSRTARDNYELGWGSAALIWSDFVIAAVEGVREAAPLMVDDVYFDFMRTVPVFGGVSVRDLVTLPKRLSRLMNQPPHSFLFASDSFAGSISVGEPGADA